MKMHYFVNPRGKVPTDDSIKRILAEVSAKTGVERNQCRCGESVNDPRQLSPCLEKAGRDEWEIILLTDDDRAIMLSDNQKDKFQQLCKDSIKLTGLIALDIVNTMKT